MGRCPNERLIVDGHNLLPVERIVFGSSVVTIGTFRCPADAAYFHAAPVSPASPAARRVGGRRPSSDLLEVACRFGFYGHRHFTAAFRSAFGVTPSQFRDDCRGRGSMSRLQRALRQALPAASNGTRLSSSS
jgi:AraC-like DNA-binding protein